MALRVENSTASIALGKESRANGWWRFRDTRSKEPENLGYAKTPFPALLFEACWVVTRVNTPLGRRMAKFSSNCDSSAGSNANRF